MTVVAPRVVVVTRPTELDELARRHGTRAQIAFFLRTRGQDLCVLEDRHTRFAHALAGVLAAIPASWRRARVDRADLPRFLFEPDDLVVAVGQDGLVANLAKYLRGQYVLGVNPDPAAYDGVLVRHAPDGLSRRLALAHARDLPIEERTMVRARLDDGQTLLALNEIFIGHRTHQSARYRVRIGDADARHVSSGLVVATGTGATGWARSIARQRAAQLSMPAPAQAALCYFAREVFPSRATDTCLDGGLLDSRGELEIVSEMNDDGVLFGDGIEQDRIDFHWGLRVRIGVAEHRLRLAV